MKQVLHYVRTLLRNEPPRRVLRCPNCGCTYSPEHTTCEECWNDRLVRIR